MTSNKDLSNEGKPIEKDHSHAIKKFLINYYPALILLGLIIVASLISPIFLTSQNISNLIRQQVTYSIIAIGMMMVLLTGGIDLSVSSMAAISSIMVAYSLTKLGLNGSVGGLLLAMLIGIACATGIGVINGFLISVVKVTPIITTLATMMAFQGVGFIITKGSTIMLNTTKPAAKLLTSFAGSGDPLFNIPYPIYVAVLVVLVFMFIMNYTTFGRLLMATGSNEVAVRLSGINTKKYIFSAYVISGILSGIAGVIITARTGTATPLTAGVDYNMTTIAAVVIGGTSLLGGEGKVSFTVIGIFIIAVIGNIMNLINLPTYPQMVVKAAIIIIAVLLKGITSKRTA
ncbi:MAG: ABC transporter permease [Eubacteriaceae bacterium]|nr:ABC transporter permease [Eubacteriaceae bacterium]